MKTRKLLALLLVIIMVIPMIVACGKSEDPSGSKAPGGSDAGEVKDDKTLVIYSSGAFQGAWDPTKNSILSNKHLEYQVMDCLLNYDAQGNLSPNIAHSWEYLEDGYTLRIYLNKGVKFHDGTELTAEDVIATMVYMTRRESSRYADYGCPFEGNAVDEYTVDIWPSNKTPLASLLTLLAHDPIISSEDIEAGILDEGINGTGPYKFVKYENETCYLEAFEDYWNPERKAKTKYCEYKYVAEPATRMAALQAGEAHVIERVDIEQVPVLEADDSVTVAKVQSEEHKYMIFKCTQDVMQNKLVRQAIAHAIDRETIVNDIMQGYGVLADCYVPQMSNLYTPLDYMFEYDLEKAAKLLAEAGYPNGEGLPVIKYITSTGFYPKTKEYAEFIVSTLAEIGVQVELVVEESAIWEAHLYEEDSCLMVDTGWMNMYGDGNAYLAVHYTTPGRCNFSSYPEVDAAVAKESAATDPEERMKILKEELYPLLVDTCTNFPLFDSIMVYGYSNSLDGVEFLPNSNFRFADISFK